MRLLGLIFLFVAMTSCKTLKQDQSETLATSGSKNTRIWSVSGYLPENPQQKVWVTMQGDTIAGVSTSEPQSGAKIDTDNLIFPGLMDLHGHVKYNVLPLWNLARGQFLNRFEWRTQFGPYKKAVSFNMKPIKEDTVCAAVRWAEVKALTGGATGMQGIGGDSKCATEFGVRNVDIANEYRNKEKIRGLTDTILPDFIRATYNPKILKYMNASKSNYDEAYQKFLLDEGVVEWVNTFTKSPRNGESAMILLLGKVAAKRVNGAAITAGKADAIEIQLNAAGVPKVLSEVYARPDNTAKKDVIAMAKWIEAYVALKDGQINNKQAYGFLGKGGVMAIASSTRRYINMFEISVRNSLQEYYKEKESLAAITHLAEGARNDAYNKSEYEYLKMYGLANPKLVIIHGVGLDAKQLQDAAKNGISIVWSPFSNLLLYGETLDIVAAKKAGVNLTLGTDWSPTGSKTILDELKIARRYLDEENISFSDEELVALVTTNAAKALKRSDVVGQVKPKFQADLTLVSKCQGNPYSCLIKAEQADVNMVIVGGEPLYGDQKVMANVASGFGDNVKLEALPLDGGSKCTFKKAIRFPQESSYDKTLKNGVDFRSVAGIQKELTTKMDAFAADVKSGKNKDGKAEDLVKLDRLFNCEDDSYSKRFQDFVEKEVPANRQQRAQLRMKWSKLDDKWSPLTSASDEEDGDESSDSN